MRHPIKLVKTILGNRKRKNEKHVSLQVKAFNLGYRAQMIAAPENRESIQIIEEMMQELTHKEVVSAFSK